jgi:hypothetical protein
LHRNTPCGRSVFDMERKKAPALGQKRKSTSLAIDPVLHRRAQHFAIDNGKRLKDVFNEALEEYLKKRGA